MGRNLKATALSIVLVVTITLSTPMVLDLTNGEKARSSSTQSELRLGFTGIVDSMNPYLGVSDAAWLFYGLVYDTLTTVGNDMEVVPNLAQEWWAVPDDIGDPDMVGMPYGSVWQYNLTRNATWSDGVPFTADDVVYTVWLNAEVTHYDSMWEYQPFSYFMQAAWKVDNYTVRISFWDRATGSPMAASYGYLLSIPILPKHMLETIPFSDIGCCWTGVFTDAESPGMPIVGTGPFIAEPNIFDNWISGNNLTLLRNPSYHLTQDAGKTVKFDRLVLKFFTDAPSMSLALASNQIDAAAFPQSTFEGIKSAIASGTLQNVATYDGPKITQYFTEVGFCMKESGPNPSRLDPVIRKALHMATDKQHIVDTYYYGSADAGSTLVAPLNSFWHYEPNAGETFVYNLTAAAALLEANGYVDTDSDGIRECTNSSPAVRLGYVNEGTELRYEMLVRHDYPEENEIASYLQYEWAQIGVAITYMIVNDATMYATIYSYDYDTVLLYWTGEIDPNYILFGQSQRAWNAWSDNMYYNPSYEENYTKSVETMDPAVRKTFVDNCQRIFYNDSAYIILAYTHQTYAWRTDTFSGWGDWSADPGRSLDTYWSADPILFDLEPIDNLSPEVVAVATPNPAEFGDTVTLNGSLSSDNVGIVDYNWTFVYDGVPQELHGQIVQFVFITPGTYNITLNCTDAAGNYNTTTISLVVNPVIPEFASVTMVSFGLLVLFIAVRRPKRRRSDLEHT